MSDRSKKIVDFNIDETFTDTDTDETDIGTMRYSGEHDTRIMEDKNYLFEFLEHNTELHRGKKDDETNIINGERGNCYSFKSDTSSDKNTITRFFNRLEKCRRKKITLMFYEKQDAEKSGIMLDFDFKLKEPYKLGQIENYTKQRLVTHIIRIIKENFDLEPYLKISKHIIVGIISNPKKNNFHILIPGLLLSRAEKKFLIYKILESKILDEVFSDLDLLEKNMLDEASAHVPVLLIGSTRYAKKDDYSTRNKVKPTYTLTDVWEVRISGKREIIPIPNTVLNNNNPNANICFEFSLNFERSQNCIIKKIKIHPQESAMSELEMFTNKIGRSEKDLAEYNRIDSMLSILKEVDPDITFVRKLINILHPFRSQCYLPWTKVTQALACMGEDYKGISMEFNLKCSEKYDREDYEKKWQDFKKEKFYPDYSRALGIIQFWARMDNPAQYEILKKLNIASFIQKLIYDITIEGQLEHAHIAEILHKICKNKFVVDRPKGERKHIWYEFILEEKNAKKGEILKWREIEDSYNSSPMSLEKYISSNLRETFKRILISMKNKKMRKPDGVSEDERKQYDKHDALIIRNFKNTCRRICNDQFLKGIVNRCKPYFSISGFSEGMDKNGYILGVGNGVLEMFPDGAIKLIQEYHSHKITKYTTTYYKSMDFKNPMVLYILRLIRNMFPNDRIDSFNWFMHWLGSMLDGLPKDQFLLMLYGQGNNGKSLITTLFEKTFGEDYSYSINSTLLTAYSKSAESATPEFMKIKGRHFIKFSEVNLSMVINIQTLKRLLGGEYVSGRKLHSDTVQFEPICAYVILLNALLEIPTPEEATWKRIKLLNLPYRFYPVNHHLYQADNKFHKPADVHAKEKLATTDAKEAFLSIVVFYWQSLQVKYGGKLGNVPHENINRDTQEYRNKQDTLSNFINSRLVNTDKDTNTYMTDIINSYGTWYESKYNMKIKLRQTNLEESLKNSKIGSLFVESERSGQYLKGLRFLNPTQDLKDDETFVYKLNAFNRKNTLSEDIDNASESLEETMLNIEKSYEWVMDEIIKRQDTRDTKTYEQKEADRKEREVKRLDEMKLNAEEYSQQRRKNLQQRTLKKRPVQRVKMADDESSNKSEGSDSEDGYDTVDTESEAEPLELEDDDLEDESEDGNSKSDIEIADSGDESD